MIPVFVTKTDLKAETSKEIFESVTEAAFKMPGCLEDSIFLKYNGMNPLYSFSLTGSNNLEGAEFTFKTNRSVDKNKIEKLVEFISKESKQEKNDHTLLQGEVIALTYDYFI